VSPLPATTLRAVRRVVTPIATVDEVAGIDADDVVAFRLADGATLCEIGTLPGHGRVAVWCPAPHGVPDEMAATEPARFVRVMHAGLDTRWHWLATYLDGTGDDLVDWDEIAAIVTDALAVVTAAPGPNADASAIDVAAMEHGGRFTFTAPLWIHSGGSWRFVSVPPDVGAAMAEAGALLRRGFGSLKVTVTIGSSTWSTSVFPDADSGSFLLPVKKPIRSANGLNDGDLVQVMLVLSEA